MPLGPLHHALAGRILPVLDLKNRMGLTDYIDFLLPDDLSAPIMCGVDAYSRPFVAFKVQAQAQAQAVENREPYEIVGTFFQRFSDNMDAWAFGTTFLTQGEIYHDSRVREDDYASLENRLKRLIAGETVSSISCNVDGDGPLDVKLSK